MRIGSPAHAFFLGSSLLLALPAVSAAQAAPSIVCDVDGDGDVDTVDLTLIRLGNRRPASSATDPLDANRDGRIDVADVRYCQLRLTTKTIDAAGGTVTAPNGVAQLTVPAGALTGPTTVRISQAPGTPVPDDLDDVTGLGQVFSLEPHGVVFERPVTMSINYADVVGAVGSPDEIGVLHWDAPGESVDVATAIDDPGTQTLSFSLESFSFVSLVRIPGGASVYRTRWTIPLLTVSGRLSVFDDWSEHTGGIAFTTSGNHDHVVVHGTNEGPVACPAGHVKLRDTLLTTCMPSLTRPLGNADQVHIWLHAPPGNPGGAPIPEPNTTFLRHAIGHALGIAHPWRRSAGGDDDQPIMAPVGYSCTHPFFPGLSCLDWRMSRRSFHALDIDAIQFKYGTPPPPAPTLLTPAPDALIPQNDPTNGCALLPLRPRSGYGHRIAFDWTNVPGATSYRVVAKHEDALNPALNVVVASSNHTFTSCNSFVIDTNLEGWSWHVQAFNGVWGPFSEARPFAYLPCRLPDGSPCDTAPGPYPSPVPADLITTMTDLTDPAVSGEALSYVITVRNVGGAAALDAVVTDSLPPGLLAPVCATSHGGCTILAGSVIASLGIVHPGVTATVTITGTAPLVSGTTFVINRAVATTSSPEVTTGNNRAARTTRVTTAGAPALGGGPRGAFVPFALIDPTSPDTVYLGTVGGVYKSTDAGATWTAVNTNLAAASINALAMDPANPLVLYAGTVNGVSKSVNGGVSWTTMRTGLTTRLQPNVHSLAIDDTDSSVVYAGTFADGVFRSVDGGATWAAVNDGLTGVNIQALVVAPGGVVYAGTGDAGVFKSIDGGHWDEANVGLAVDAIQAITIDPANPSVLYASTLGGGVFKSLDSATTWTASNTGLTPTDVRAVAVDPSNSAILYAATVSGVFKSTNAGAIWSAANAGMRVLGCCVPGTFSLAIDPSNPSVIYVGTLSDSGVFKSIDAAATWAAVNDGLNAGFTSALALDPAAPATVYAATRFAAVYKSTDQGQTWDAANSGFFTVLTTSLAIDPTAPATVYAGTAGGTIRRVYKSTNGGATWTITGLSAATSILALAIDPVAPTTLYAATQGQGVFKTMNGGTSWVPANTGLGNLFVQALAIDPSNPAILYAATQGGGVFKTINGGSSWTPANVGLAGLNVFTVAVDPSATTTLYAGTNSGLYKSVNGGSSWSSSGNGITPSQIPDVQAVAVDPTSSLTVYATRNGVQKVFKSTDGGTTWTNVSVGLPVPPMSLLALVIDPVTPSTIYVTTSAAGVFRSVDGGATWQPTGSN